MRRLHVASNNLSSGAAYGARRYTLLRFTAQGFLQRISESAGTWVCVRTFNLCVALLRKFHAWYGSRTEIILCRHPFPAFQCCVLNEWMHLGSRRGYAIPLLCGHACDHRKRFWYYFYTLLGLACGSVLRWIHGGDIWALPSNRWRGRRSSCVSPKGWSIAEVQPPRMDTAKKMEFLHKVRFC